MSKKLINKLQDKHNKRMANRNKGQYISGIIGGTVIKRKKKRRSAAPIYSWV